MRRVAPRGSAAPRLPGRYPASRGCGGQVLNRTTRGMVSLVPRCGPPPQRNRERAPVPTLPPAGSPPDFRTSRPGPSPFSHWSWIGPAPYPHALIAAFRTVAYHTQPPRCGPRRLDSWPFPQGNPAACGLDLVRGALPKRQVLRSRQRAVLGGLSRSRLLLDWGRASHCPRRVVFPRLLLS